MVSPMDMGSVRGPRSCSPLEARSALALIAVQACSVSMVEPPWLSRRWRRIVREHGDRDGDCVAQEQTAISLRKGIDLKPVLTRSHGRRNRDLGLIACSAVSDATTPGPEYRRHDAVQRSRLESPLTIRSRRVD